HRNLDEPVGFEVQAGHLTVDPHQFVTHSAPDYAHRAGRCPSGEAHREMPVGAARRTTHRGPYPRPRAFSSVRSRSAGRIGQKGSGMTSGSTANPAQDIAAGYAVSGAALQLGSVMVDGPEGPVTDPDAQVRIPMATVNRHGLIAGATGTGKTKSLQLMAEQLSAAGVPVVMADIKGDLSGLA